MVDPQKVRHLLALYRRYRRYLTELAARPDEALRSDFAVMGGVQHYLLLAVETVVDLGSHVISSEGYEPPKSYADIFRVLSLGVANRGSGGCDLAGCRALGV